MRAWITDGTSRARLATAAATAGVAFAWCLLAGCSGRPAGYAGEDATRPLLDAGTGPDAAAVADAAPTPDGSGCVEVPTRFPSSESYPDWDNRWFCDDHWYCYSSLYVPLEGCEGQPYIFQDERCLDWMLDQFVPEELELSASKVADLERETVVVVEHHDCFPEICDAMRCPGALTVSVQPGECGDSLVVQTFVSMIVVPKTDREEITIACYDKLDGVCAPSRWGEPYSTGHVLCF